MGLGVRNVLILSTRVSDTQSPEEAFQKLFMVSEIRKGLREIRIWMMKNNKSTLQFLKWNFRHCVGGIIRSVQQRVRIRLLKKQKRSICHVTSDIKQSITRNRLVLHYSRSVKRCYGFQPIGATRCYALLSNIWGVFWRSMDEHRLEPIMAFAVPRMFLDDNGSKTSLVPRTLSTRIVMGHWDGTGHF